MRYTLSWTAFLEQIGHSAINRHTREESTYPGGTASILISFTHRSLALLSFLYQERSSFVSMPFLSLVPSHVNLDIRAREHFFFPSLYLIP